MLETVKQMRSSLPALVEAFGKIRFASMINGDSLDAHIMHNACTTHMPVVCGIGKR
jgi:hypothetical protein